MKKYIIVIMSLVLLVTINNDGWGRPKKRLSYDVEQVIKDRDMKMGQTLYLLREATVTFFPIKLTFSLPCDVDVVMLVEYRQNNGETNFKAIMGSYKNTTSAMVWVGPRYLLRIKPLKSGRLLIMEKYRQGNNH
ncbi:MAG: hypothetical protein ACP5MB_11530 [bacterium]